MLGKLGAAGVQGSCGSPPAHRDLLSCKVPSVPFATNSPEGKEGGTTFQMPARGDAMTGSSCPCFCHTEISYSSVSAFTPIPEER